MSLMVNEELEVRVCLVVAVVEDAVMCNTSWGWYKLDAYAGCIGMDFVVALVVQNN